MNADVRIVASPAVAAGITLAGLPVVVAPDAAAGGLRVAELADDPSVGVILVEESWHEQLSDTLRARFARTPVPLVVPFPGPVWAAEREAAEAYIVALLRRAIGYRVKLT